MQIAPRSILRISFAFLMLGSAAAAAASVPDSLWPIFGFAIVYALILYQRPSLWLLLLPALLPIADQTKLSGHIFVTESDMLILLTLGMACFKPLANVAALAKHRKKNSWTFALLLGLMLTSYLLSTLLSLWPQDAMRLQLTGYHSYWNSLRVAKGFFFSILFIPLLQTELKADAAKAMRLFCYGLCLGLAAVAAFALYERLAFTSLTDFTSDYRITASFWEMNVGGAALDGFLVLTFPFAAWLVFGAQRGFGHFADPEATFQFKPAIRLALGLLLLLTASYVLLVTFTRTTTAAAGLMGLIIFLGRWGQHRHQTRTRIDPMTASWKSLLTMLALIGLIVLMHLVFQTGGYRTLAALVMVIMASHYVAPAVNLQAGQNKLLATGLGFALSAASLTTDLLISKGSYLAFASLAASLMVIAWQGHKEGKFSGLIAGLWIGLITAGALIARHWGGSPALMDYSITAALLLLIVVTQWISGRRLWRWSAASSSGLLIVSVMIGLSVAVLGNYQMLQRFSQVNQNWTERQQHWTTGMRMLKTPQDWVLGLGTGSYPYRYLWGAPERLMPGTVAFINKDGEHFVRLTSSHTEMGPAEMLRLMQHVSLADLGNGPIIVRLRTRMTQTTKLAVEICGRHLIYPDDCSDKELYDASPDGQWHDQTLILNGGHLNGGPWYAPKSYYFALGIGSTAKTADIASVELIGNSLNNKGSNLLQNADFHSGSDHWFFSSDRSHLPYHIKNLFLHLLFEQGMLGLTAFSILLVAVLVRTWKYRHGWNNAWNDAPYFLAGIIGFVFTGLFDSLLDVPRIAFLFYLMCWLLLLRPRPSLSPSNKS